MNWQHLQTILWLRWRLSVNRFSRGGIWGPIIMGFLLVACLGTSLTLFTLSLVLGVMWLPRATPEHVLYIWDGLVIAMLFFWMVGLVAELQRGDVLSFEKLLHLPMSLAGTFLINFVSSLLTISTVLFVPVMVGLSIASLPAWGASALVNLPLVLAFVLMVTALTYQFRGWIATLMLNKRRRRAIIAAVTILFVLLSQIPNILNSFFMRRRVPEAPQAQGADRHALKQQLEAGQLGRAEYDEKLKGLDAAAQQARGARRRQQRESVHRVLTIVNLAVPVGWLPYGAAAASRHSPWPGLAGCAGMLAIGALSLRRSYRTTLRYHTGAYQGSAPARQPAAGKIVPAATRPARNWLEGRIPWISEHAAAVALTSLRSLSRAPEIKMVLLSPLVILLVFGSMLLSRRGVDVASGIRPLLALGAIGITMLSMLQLNMNQFGLDRQGFRALVLTAAPRREILLGKNLSTAPITFGIGTIALTAVQLLFPMAASHFVASLVQLVLVGVLFSAVGNMASILAPMAIAAGTLKASQPRFVTILMQLAFATLFPFAILPPLVAYGAEVLLHHLGWLTRVPIYLLLTGLEAAVIVPAYALALNGQGALLQQREQRVLEVVTKQVE